MVLQLFLSDFCFYGIYTHQLRDRQRFHAPFLFVDSLQYSLVARLVNPEMLSTLRYFDGNVIYDVWELGNRRMLIYICWAISVVSLISILIARKRNLS